MDVSYLLEKLEIISEKVHCAWMKEKTSQGFHSPESCPNVAYDDQRALQEKFTKRCGKCHSDLYPYGEIPENIKEYDRVTVRAVLQAISEL